MTDAVHSSRPSTRERRKALFMALTGIFMLVYPIALVADLLIDANLLPLTVALVVASVASACAWARQLDEAKLNAHYIAWFWGGSAGLMAAALTYLALLPTLLTPGGVDALFPAPLAPFASNLAFMAGFLLGVMPAAIGYAIWWCVLWLRRN